MAGFSPAEADDLRKAVGKKKRDLMATMKEKFIEGMAASNTDRKVAKRPLVADGSRRRLLVQPLPRRLLRADLLPDRLAASANYPAEYMAALISTVMSTKDKVPFFVNRCAEMGIEVLPPDVNTSDHGFVVSGNSDPLRPRRGQERRSHRGPGDPRRTFEGRELRLDCGTSASGWIAGPLTSELVECLVRMRSILTPTDASRKGLLEALPAAIAFGQKAQEDSASGQSSIFDLGAGRRSPVRRGTTTRRSEQRSSTSASFFASRRRRSAPSSLLASARRGQGGAPAAGGLPALHLADKPGRILGDGWRDHHRVQAAQVEERLADVVRDPRRRRGQVEMLVMGKAYEASRNSSPPTRS